MVRPMIDDTRAPWRPTGDLISAAMDHVRLSYGYLDDGDIDAYCSLFITQAVARRPGARPVTGRDALERDEQARLSSRRVRHVVDEVFGSGRRVAALGRLRPRHAGDSGHDTDVDFVDVFTVADNGLLATRTTFLFSPTHGAQ